MKVTLGLKSVAAAVALTVVGSGAAVADSYPERPVQVIVPFGAGGGSDSLVRLMQPTIEENLGTDVVVINVPGAGSVTGSRRVLDAKPNGYEVLVNHTTLLTAVASGKADFGVADFDIVASGAVMPLVVVVPKGSSLSSMDALLAAAKDTSSPTIAGVNIGALNHFAMGMVQSADAGAEFRYVQTGGGAATSAALLGNHINVGVLAGPEAIGLVESGDVIAIAALTADRIDYLPEVPTAKEQGYDIEIGIEYSWYMPKGTPADVRATFSEAIEKSMTDADLVAAMDERGIGASFYTAGDAAGRVDALLDQLKTIADGMK